IVRRKGLANPERILRILMNPFYAAHYKTKNEYQLLPHVEPMISLDIYLAAKSRIDKFVSYYQEKILDMNKLFIITPRCGECNEQMKHRRENPLDAGYFVCRAN